MPQNLASDNLMVWRQQKQNKSDKANIQFRKGTTKQINLFSLFKQPKEWEEPWVEILEIYLIALK